MTKSELVQLLGWRLGDRDDVEERINAELVYIQDNVLEAKEWCPWFLLSEESHASTVAGDARVPLPDDFLMEAEEQHLYILVNGEKKELTKVDPDRILRKGEAPGVPYAYASVGEYLYFYPLPDAAYPVYMRYYKKDIPLNTEGTVPKWFKYAGDVVLSEVGKVIAGKHLKDAGAEASFAADAQAAWIRLYSKHTAMQDVNMARNMGDN